MPTVNNAENVRLWMRDCPALSPNNHFRIDYLSDRTGEYAIYAVPTTITFHENVLGESVPNTVQTLDFIFASKEPFGADEQQNIENYGFFQDVVCWIISQNSLRNLPRLNEGRVTSVIPTLSQFVSATGTANAKYQIQIKITYRLY